MFIIVEDLEKTKMKNVQFSDILSAFLSNRTCLHIFMDEIICVKQNLK